MDKQQILQIASQSPDFEQAVAALQAEMQTNPVTPEGLAELIKMFEFALNTPDAYPQVRQAAIADGYVDPEDLPEQFDQTVLVSVLAALYIIQEQLGAAGGAQAPLEAPAQFARGGLAQAGEHLRRQGRHGDTMLAHINPREAEMLRRAGGGGTVNPQTGLPEFWSLKSVFKAVAPIALTFLAPGIGTAIGSALGASGIGASMLGSAVLGGGAAALSGGDVMKGALLGGLGGGLGGAVGGATSDALGLGLGQTGQALLGSGLVGGAAGALTGQGFGKGALQGVAGQALGQAVGGMGGAGLEAAGKNFGNMMTAGYDLKTAAAGGALAGLATGMMKPSQVAVDSARSGGEIAPGQAGTTAAMQGGFGETAAPTTPAAADSGLGFNANTGLKALMLANALGGQPPEAQQAIQQMSPQQQEYFNRPSLAFDWSAIQRDAGAAGLDLSRYMAQNWNKIASGTYNQPVQRPGYAHGGYAAGGALSTVARMARGAGSGRADTIDARLSDGEYVMDAETVAMLGDGSTQEGAKRLDAMRSNLRSHKGKALSRGQISPDAKSPLAYLKGSK